MVSFGKKIIPAKVKTKLFTILGVLITLMVAVPSILSYRATLNNTCQKPEQELTATITQVRDTITVDHAAQLKILAHTVAGMPSIRVYARFPG